MTIVQVVIVFLLLTRYLGLIKLTSLLFLILEAIGKANTVYSLSVEEERDINTKLSGQIKRLDLRDVNMN